MVMRSDRRRFLPYGLTGGAAGTPSWNLRNAGTPAQSPIPVMPMEAVRFEKDETFLHVSGGGGGHGDPLEREPEAVLKDVREEILTIEYAREVYGVAIVEGRVDTSATAALRAELRTASAQTDRPRHLRHFHDELGISEFRMVGEREMDS